MNGELFDCADASAATNSALDAGFRVMQPYQFGATDAEHVAVLLRRLDPPAGAHVLDAGCGIGEVARLMAESRPDLSFVLANSSAHQLSMAPTGEQFTHWHVDFHRLPCDAASFDAVMFNAAFCHSDRPEALLREAARVLIDGGTLMIVDMLRRGGDNRALSAEMHAYAHRADDMGRWAMAAGFSLSHVEMPPRDDDKFRALVNDDGRYSRLYGELHPVVWKFERRKRARHAISADAIATIDRHQRIGLHLSGGKDSLATLHLLRPYWHRLTVYWMNTGAAFPETVAMMDRIRAKVPHFVEVVGNQPAQLAAHGWPTDLMPTTSTPDGQAIEPGGIKLQDRYQCCYRSLMLPMHERMLADGVTLIIRGQRSEESAKSPARSGYVDPDSGIELLFPIEGWSESDVYDYLHRHKIPVPAFYDIGNHSIDCMTCTAWWGHGHLRYLRERHPAHADLMQGRLDRIKVEIERPLTLLSGATE